MLRVMINNFVVDRFKKPAYVNDMVDFVHANWVYLLVLVVVFLASNLVYYYFNDVSSIYHLSGDSIDYNNYALIFLHNPRINFDVDRLPGFIIWLGALYHFFGKTNLFAVFLGNVFLSGMVGVALYSIFLRLGILSRRN